MQKFIAEESFWELFPDAVLGIAVVNGMKSSVDIPASDKASIASLLVEANKAADQYLTSSIISENEVVKIWREAFQKFKTKKGARCSIENLLKRVLKGNPVGAISPSVDIYNAISLKYGVPVGGEDIDAFVGNMRLGITEGGDVFLPLGEENEDPTLAGELCYRDDIGAICRCWNWRDGQRTALSDQSENVFMIIESVDSTKRDELVSALDELVELLSVNLGATIEVKAIIDRQNPEVIIKS